MTDEWVEWHKGYGKDTNQARRLAVVQDKIRQALNQAAPGPIQVISMCAGDGRDLSGALQGHPRSRDVRARLVEFDGELTKAGRDRFSQIDAPGVDFLVGDASNTDAYAGMVPSKIVLACGVFGNITDEDVKNTIDHLPELCAQGSTVIWTRGRFEPDLTPRIRDWFRAAGFEEVSFVAIPDSTASVGVHRLVGHPRPFRPHQRLFTFLPFEQRPSNRSRATQRSSRPSHPSTDQPA